MHRSKNKRKVHIDNEIWYWWVGSGRYNQATHITICSPDKKYYTINSSSEDGKCFGFDADPEYCYPKILPSTVKEYILKKIIKTK